MEASAEKLAIHSALTSDHLAVLIVPGPPVEEAEPKPNFFSIGKLKKETIIATSTENKVSSIADIRKRTEKFKNDWKSMHRC